MYATHAASRGGIVFSSVCVADFVCQHDNFWTIRDITNVSEYHT